MSVNTDRLREVLSRAREEIGRVIIGQQDVIDRCLAAIFTGQHALIEGVPGLGKTMLVKALAQVLGCDFARIQFTPDLMPADITGTNVFHIPTQQFTLIRGPIFTTFLLADEINRAPAKTQSALLQAMQERQVSIDRETHDLSPDFTVFATQNPIEYEGTYPLPEAQKDRFLLKITMPYPEREEEMELVRRTLGENAPETMLARQTITPILRATELASLRRELEHIVVREELVAYAVDVVRQTRRHESVSVGGGSRAAQALMLASRAFAAIAGRDFATPDDVKSAAYPVLEHRIVLRPEYEIEGLGVAEVIAKVLEAIPVPR